MSIMSLAHRKAVDSEQLKKEALNRWENVTAAKLAEVLFTQVKGNTGKLHVPPGHPNSIWGKIVKGLKFPNTNLDRLWAFAAFQGNHNDVQEKLRSVYESTETRYKESDFSFLIKGEKFCFCQKIELENGDPAFPMVECGTCLQWYHGVCVGVIPMDFLNTVYNCPVCLGTPEEHIAPALFRPIQRKGVTSSPGARLTHTTNREATPGKQSTFTRDMSPDILSTVRDHIRNPRGDESERHTRHRDFLGRMQSDVSHLPPLSPLTKTRVRDDPTSTSTGSIYPVPAPVTTMRGSSRNVSPLVRSIVSDTSDTEVQERHGRKFRFKKNDYVAQTERSTSQQEGIPETRESVLKETEITGDSECDDFEANVTIQPAPAGAGNSNDPYFGNDNETRSAQGGRNVTPDEERLSGREVDNLEANPILPESDDENRMIDGPTEGFPPFTIVIEKDEYKLIEDRVFNQQARDKRFQWQYPKGKWSHIFFTSFLRGCNPQMKGCKLTFHDHRFPSETVGAGTDYFQSSAKCTRKGSVQCSMKYTFIIAKKPKRNSDVKVTVSPSGILHHDISIIDKRPLAGLRRDDAKAQMREKSAGIYRREKYGDPKTDVMALNRSNLTEVQTLEVLRVAKMEERSKDDFDKDVLSDLMKRADHMRTLEHLRGTNVIGFIQELSINPFYVSLYTDRQLLLLKRYLSYNPSLVLHLDSTGKVTAKLPSSLGEKQSYYYAVVIQLPGSEEAPCVPVCEFITNQHFAGNISHILHYFFRRFGENFSKDELAFGIKRFETDCSRPLIAAVLQGLEIGRVDRYLKDAWKCLQTNSKIYFVHHICRSHSTKFIGDSIKKHFREGDRHVLLTWCNRFLFSKTLQDFCRRVHDIVVISGKQYYTTEVQETIAMLSEATLESGTPMWSTNHLMEVPDTGRFYVTSPFSNFAVKLCYKLKVPDMASMYTSIGFAVTDQDEDDFVEAADANYMKNPFYSTEFLKYAIKQIFSLGCLYNHSLLHLNGFSTAVDTNATSEAWNKILKKDEMTSGLGMKIGRFISFSEDLLRGRLLMFENGLTRMERRSGGRRGTTFTQSLHDDSEDENIPTPEASTERWGAPRVKIKQRPKPPDSILGLPVLKKGLSIDTPDGANDMTDCINIDNCLQILYSFFKLNHDVVDYFKNVIDEEGHQLSNHLLDVFKKIDDHSYQAAKQLAIETIMRIDFDYISTRDFIRSEINFIQSIANIFPVYEISDCKKSCPMATSHKIFPLRDFIIRTYQSIPVLLKRQQYRERCELCKKEKVIVEYRWANSGVLPLLVYPVDLERYEMVVENIPTLIGVIGSKFSLFAYTFYLGSTFYAVIIHDTKMFRYDGQRFLEVKTKPPVGHKISSVWYSPKR